MTRAEFDALVDAALVAIMAEAPTPPGARSTRDSDAAREEAALLQAEAETFADAVDRDGKRIPYGEAVVLEGTAGLFVAYAAEYARDPATWRALVGRPDRITEGPVLLEVLTRAAHRAA